MSYKYGGFKDCLIDIDRASEFTGDDVDRYSKLIDLGFMCDGVTIVAPTITSATISVYVQEGGLIATIPKVLHYKRTADETTSAEWKTTAGTGASSIYCNGIGGFRFIRLYSSADQTSDRTFRVCGARD